MKFLRQVLSAIALIGAVAGVSSALAASDAKDLVLKGDAKCTKCHDEGDSPKVLLIGSTKHGVNADGRTPTCTSCHGASETHLAKAGKGPGETPMPDITFGAKSKNTADEKSGACLGCHKGDNNRNHWAGSKHQTEGVACSSCHEVHAQDDKVRDKATQTEVCFNCHKEQRADSKKISVHPLSKIGCSGCHNPHGSTGDKLVKKNTINETCFTCHAEKRGPFLWEHQSAAENCANCHTPHGSNIAPLMRARPNFLCQECHDGVHQSSSPVGPVAAGFQGGLAVQNAANNISAQPSVGQVGRACMNCHTQVHGSNSPTGSWLHR
jgi:DmsE family decaheme c-type cytochrome